MAFLMGWGFVRKVSWRVIDWTGKVCLRETGWVQVCWKEMAQVCWREWGWQLTGRVSLMALDWLRRVCWRVQDFVRRVGWWERGRRTLWAGEREWCLGWMRRVA